MTVEVKENQRPSPLLFELREKMPSGIITPQCATAQTTNFVTNTAQGQVWDSSIDGD